MGYTILGKVETLEEFEELQKKNEKEDIQDIMIRASNKAGITRNQLLNVLFEDGVLAIYNLGMKHMYEYLKEQTHD